MSAPAAPAAGTIRSLYSTTIGKKLAMAASAVILTLWIIAHMVGNLKVFQGADKFNDYSDFLRLVGAPVLGDTQLLWGVRAVLFAALAVHVVAFLQLWRRSARARAVRYHKYDPQVFSYASRTMKWGGIAILLFVVYHVLHLTTGDAHPEFIHGDPYRNLITAFASPLVVLVYLAAVAALGLHLYHGIWSALQTFGFSNPRYNSYRRPTALLVALVVSIGFAVVPLAIVTGLVGAG